MDARAAIGLVGLFVFLLALLLRRRPARRDLGFDTKPTNRGKTVTIEEMRQRLETAKAHYQGPHPEAFNQAVDDFVASLQARYGDQVPVVEALKLSRKLPFYG